MQKALARGLAFGQEFTDLAGGGGKGRGAGLKGTDLKMEPPLGAKGQGAPYSATYPRGTWSWLPSVSGPRLLNLLADG